jgi:hypothetical protein
LVLPFVPFDFRVLPLLLLPEVLVPFVAFVRPEPLDIVPEVPSDILPVLPCDWVEVPEVDEPLVPLVPP